MFTVNISALNETGGRVPPLARILFLEAEVRISGLSDFNRRSGYPWIPRLQGDIPSPYPPCLCSSSIVYHHILWNTYAGLGIVLLPFQTKHNLKVRTRKPQDSAHSGSTEPRTASQARQDCAVSKSPSNTLTRAHCAFLHSAVPFCAASGLKCQVHGWRTGEGRGEYAATRRTRSQ